MLVDGDAGGDFPGGRGDFYGQGLIGSVIGLGGGPFADGAKLGGNDTRRYLRFVEVRFIKDLEGLTQSGGRGLRIFPSMILHRGLFDG